ncbi:multipass membrane protein [Candidatus Mancarchaeum acidiphilum]|uniref:Multipass membrane protein n=1 Tax=Candidatus Mancarchaeum acidiphilum TaxID=1920749 RepID=A0A218NNF7_9ARCH|nr:hypothetical protein [Candidatus Mancarchaeum acidiphilum]ASI13996.1 multipass membrane protein [Candidatus Mancarchaeum acidiphilum]
MGSIHNIGIIKRVIGLLKVLTIPFILLTVLISTYSSASTLNSSTIGIVSQLGYVRGLLSQIGPLLSAVLFILAGIFYAVGQLMTPEKKASFHTTAINLIIGAIIVAVLSFTSTTLATASTHFLSNSTLK